MERTMDICYILHADHGFNASTFSGRVTIATLSDVYSAVTSAIGTLKGYYMAAPMKVSSKCFRRSAISRRSILRG